MAWKIYDVDGTLTTTGDTPRQLLIDAIKADTASKNIILSARPVSRLEETRSWLSEHEIPFDRIYLNDFASDTGPNVALAFKTYKLGKLHEELGDAIAYLVDNDPDVRDAAEQLGITAYTPNEAIALMRDDQKTKTAGAPELRRAAMTFQVKAEGDGPVGRFTGYGSIFNEVDSYGDRVMPGAFATAIEKARTTGRMPALLWQHDPNQPIGVWHVIREDERGLYVEGELADTEDGRDAYALLKMGAISGLSIGFTTLNERYNQDGVREILEIDLWEISIVTFPAAVSARVGQVKHYSGQSMTIREFEGFLRDAGGFSNGQAKAIAARGFKALRDEVTEDVDEAWVKAMVARFQA